MDEYKQAWDQADEGAPAGPVANPADDDARELERAFNESDDPIMAAADAAEKRWAKEDAPAEKPAAPVFKSFAQAFKHHRANGDKTFTWKGKSYTTELKADRPAKPAAKPAEPVAMGNEGRRETLPPPAAKPAAPAKKSIYAGAGLNLLQAARDRNAELARRPLAKTVQQMREENRAKAAQ